MHLQSSVKPNFGTLICISPELHNSAVKEEADLIKRSEGSERAGAWAFHNTLLNTVNTMDMRPTAEFYPSKFVEAYEEAFTHGNYIDCLDMPIEVDGKQIGRALFTDDDYGDHVRDFDNFLRNRYGITNRHENVEAARIHLAEFLTEVTSNAPFNEAPGIYYLA